MTERQDWQVAAGRWWRFDRYEIREGYIRPAAGARLEVYDPWAAYWNTRRRGGELTPPYADFVNLRESLRLPPAEAEAKVTSWCEKYGLLGALLHQVRVVTLSPRWVSTDSKGRVLVPAQEQFIRTNTGWFCRRSLFQAVDVQHSFDKPELQGLPVPQNVAPQAWARTGVLRQSLRSAEAFQESLRETWWGFFPGVPADKACDYPYPEPLSEEFWRLYSEPYGVFLEGLQCLAQALWSLERHKARHGKNTSDLRRVAEGQEILHALLAPASPALVPKADGSFAQEWVCGSLLSAFAMMALQDMTESRRVRGCDACGRLFVSQHPGALYCSGPCRWKLQKRRQRQRKQGRQAAQTRGRRKGKRK